MSRPELNGVFLVPWTVDCTGKPVFTAPPVPALDVSTPIRPADPVAFHSRHVDPDPDEEGETRLVIRCTRPAKGWAQGLADHNAMTVSAVVWQGLLRIAEATGYSCGSYAPRRWPGRRRRGTLDAEP